MARIRILLEIAPHNLTMKTLTKYTLSAILGIGISYNANALQFFLNSEFSGGQQPTGSLLVDITDSGANAVDIKISSQLFGTEFLDQLYLNLNTAFNPIQLSFTKIGETGSFGTLAGGSNPVISTGTNAFSADGGGSYDISFQFDIAPPSQRFNGLLDSITYNVTLAGGTLRENSFNFDAVPHGDHGVFKAAAHIQGVAPGPNGTSGFIAHVPDGGATVTLLGTALACLGALRRRFA